MRRTMFRTMIVVLAIAASGFANDTSGLEGRVLDAQGGAVAQAQVKVLRGDGSAAASAVTGSSGEYRLEGLAPGNYVFTVERESFRSTTLNLYLGSGTTHQDVTLEVAGVNQSVVVTAAAQAQTLDEVSKPLDVISNDEIKNRNDYSLSDLLTTTPGLTVENEGGPGQWTTISARGLPVYVTSFLVDGLRFRDVANTQGDASSFIETMNIINTDHVEVLRGSASSLYGTDAAGAVVNVVTEKGGGPFHSEIQLEGGSLGMYRGRATFSGGALHDRLQYTLGLLYVNSRDGVDGHTPWRNSGTQSFLRYDFTPRMSITGRVWGTNDFAEMSNSPTNEDIPNANIPATGTIDAIALSPSQVAAYAIGGTPVFGNANYIPNVWDPDSHRNSYFVAAAGVFRHEVSSKFNWQASYQFVDTDRVYINGPEGVGYQPEYVDYGMYGGHIDTVGVSANAQPISWLGLTAGYEFEHELYRDHQDNNTPSPYWVAERTQTEQDSNAAYFSARAGLLKRRLQILLAGRAETFDVGTPQFQYIGAPNPYAGLTFNAPHALTGDVAVAYYVSRTNTKFRTHGGNSFRAPALFERFGAGFYNDPSSPNTVVFTPYGDPRLAPDRYNSVDGGIDQYLFKDRLRLSATPFYTRIVQMITFSDYLPATDPYGRYAGYIDGAGGISRGVETSAELRPTRSFSVTGSYTYVNAGTDQDTTVAGYFRVFDVPRHTVGLVATEQWTKRLTSTVDMYHYSDTLDAYVNYGRAMLFPGYTDLNLVTSCDVWQKERRSVRVYAKIGNLLDQTFYVEGWRAAGITGLGGVSFMF